MHTFWTSITFIFTEVWNTVQSYYKLKEIKYVKDTYQITLYKSSTFPLFGTIKEKIL